MNENKKLAGSSLFDKIVGKVTTHQLLFTSFTHLKDAPDDEPWIMISIMYDNDERQYRTFATLLNGVFTTGNIRFIWSVKVGGDYFEADPNVSRKSYNNTEFSKDKAKLIKAGLIKEIYPPSEFGTGKSRAGSYELVDPTLVLMLKNQFGEEYVESQLKNFESEYGKQPRLKVKFANSSTSSSTPSSTTSSKYSLVTSAESSIDTDTENDHDTENANESDCESELDNPTGFAETSEINESGKGKHRGDENAVHGVIHVEVENNLGSELIEYMGELVSRYDLASDVCMDSESTEDDRDVWVELKVRPAARALWKDHGDRLTVTDVRTLLFDCELDLPEATRNAFMLCYKDCVPDVSPRTHAAAPTPEPSYRSAITPEAKARAHALLYGTKNEIKAAPKLEKLPRNHKINR